MEHFFSPNSSTDLRSDAHQSQIIGGDADKDHTQIVGGIYSQIIGGIYPPIPPPPPPGFGTPGGTHTCLGVSINPMLLWISSNSWHWICCLFKAT